MVEVAIILSSMMSPWRSTLLIISLLISGSSPVDAFAPPRSRTDVQRTHHNHTPLFSQSGQEDEPDGRRRQQQSLPSRRDVLHRSASASTVVATILAGGTTASPRSASALP